MPEEPAADRHADVLAPRHFEEIAVGDRFTTPGYTFTEGEMLDFAFKYDPQPFHIDREHAEHDSIYGGLIASGFQTLAVCFRLVQMAGYFSGTNIGGQGLDELRWTKAIRAGDTVRVDVEIVETRASERRPDRGHVRARWNARDQHGETVLTAELLHVVKRKS